MKFKIVTLGCKVNTYESEAMKELLLKEGYCESFSDNNNDIIIINTCSVTNMADNKSKKLVRRLIRENPNAIKIVCGCSSQNNFEDYKEYDIDILLGNREKSQIVRILKEFIATNDKYYYHDINRSLDFESMKVDKFTSQTRAYIKVQDGCDNFCSYCIIPYVRGSIRSKSFADILKEANILVENGHKEIVLTGIHTGSYNYDGKDLSDLITELAKISNLERIRLSSIEITELDDKFLSVLKSTPKLVDHLHIPLQAGSSEILKRMNRKYNKEYFINKILEIRKIRPNISITTDVIVGHPYETEELFKESYEFCQLINFSKIHVFPYSKRDGTAAANMPMQVEESVKKQRAKDLIILSEKLEKDYAKSFINKELPVLIEQVSLNSIGHTSNYLKVQLNEILNQNEFYNVKIVDVKDNIIIGELVK